jgi:transcriptional regulator with XRE-family HTH domain
MRNNLVKEILANTPKEVEIFVDLYANLVLRINQLLSKNKLSQKELANSLDKSPSEISKWLSGNHNFTLRSIAKLSAELGEPLLEVPKEKMSRQFEVNGQTYQTHVSVKVMKVEKVNKVQPKWENAQISKPERNYSNVG